MFNLVCGLNAQSQDDKSDRSQALTKSGILRLEDGLSDGMLTGTNVQGIKHRHIVLPSPATSSMNLKRDNG